MSGQPGYVRWIPAEWLKVAVNMLPHLDKGMPVLNALVKAQRVLPKDRHRTEEALRAVAVPSALQVPKYVAQARALSEEERAALTIVKPPRKLPPPRGPKYPADLQRNYTGKFRWTTKEKALITRMVLWFQEQEVPGTLARLIIEAQELVLPPERRRSLAGIKQGDVHAPNSLNMKLIEEGKANLWLINTIPFNPPVAQETTADEPETTDERSDGEVLQAAAETQAPEASEALAAPTPSPTPQRTLSEAAKAFGDTVMLALDQLLATHSDLLLSKVDARISTMSQDMGMQIAAMIERGMRQTVHQLVEAELGPVNTPQAAPSPSSTGEAPAPVASVQAQHEPEAERARMLKVDVVGLVGLNITKVRESFNGTTDLRFIDPDQLNAWAPHKGRHVVCATKWIPHKAKFKLKAVGMQPINVSGGVGTVIHAIEELHRQHGVPMHG
jgi:hypothetical protein